MSVKYPNYVNLTSLSEEQPNERTPSPPPRNKSLSPPQAPSKSISSKSTHYTSSSSPSESPTPTHVAPPPKLRFVIPIKLESQELPPPQMSPNDPYIQTMDNWPPDPSNPSPPPRSLDYLPAFQIYHLDLSHCHQPNLCLLTLTTTHLSSTKMHLQLKTFTIHHQILEINFPNPPNILDFVYPNDMPHLHNMFCQCCSTTRHEI
nr:hypothetical protein [Tanacetum cinerariifolium]